MDTAFFWSVTDNTALKEVLKDAIREIVFEDNELLHEVLVAAMADDAMIHSGGSGKCSAKSTHDRRPEMKLTAVLIPADEGGYTAYNPRVSEILCKRQR